MNSEQAKKLSLPDILAKLGHQPVRTLKGGSELWYKSPFRNETDASFHTSFLGGKWIWKDFGDSGGTVLDFAITYYGSDIKGALANLERLSGTYKQSLFSEPTAMKVHPQATTPATSTATLVLRKISPLNVDSFNGKALLQYLTEKRGVDAIIAAKYLKEVQYLNQETGKAYFAVGIKNEADGYEIRNPYFKSSIGQKGISFIKGRREGQAAVFEGFMDFLSALTYYQTVDLSKFQTLVQCDTLIMNSASFQERTKELLQSGSYSTISLYLDNDLTGQKVKTMLETEFLGKTEDCSRVYQEHKDFNLFLTDSQRSQQN